MPIMLDMSDDLPAHPTASSSGPIVILGSMERMDEYQSLLGGFRDKGEDVRGEMVDRVLQGGEFVNRLFRGELG